MKAHRYIFFIAVVATLLFGSCLDETDTSGFDPTTPEISLVADGDVINIAKEGGEYTLEIKSNLPWRIKSDVDWISAVSNENGMSDGTFTFSVLRNRTTKARIGHITAWITDESQQTILVIQAPSAPGEIINNYYVKANASADNDGLTWESATTLASALEQVMMGDFIHIAAGTYHPTATLTNGNTSIESDKTFEIHSNITIIGGYPADAATGAVADPKANECILSGDMGGARAYHVVCVTAPLESNQKVLLQGLTITGGQAADKSDKGTVSVGGATFTRSWGGGIVVGRSVAEITDCVIADNKSGYHAAGVHTTPGSSSRFIRCDIVNNSNLTDGSNAPGLYNEGATVIMKECNVSGNRCSGVAGGIYAFHGSSESTTYIYNSTISGNNNNALGTSSTRGGGGFYAREGSVSLLVNCTISGNNGGDGGGISLYGTAARAAVMDMVNTTITGNNAERNGGGFINNNTNTTFRMYNSIISGNTTVGDSPEMKGTINNRQYSIVGPTVYNNTGGAVDGVSFDALTMFGALTNNGGTTPSHQLIGSGNPALTLGMSYIELTALGSTLSIDPSITGTDQAGLSREGLNIIGACVKQ